MSVIEFGPDDELTTMSAEDTPAPSLPVTSGLPALSTDALGMHHSAEHTTGGEHVLEVPVEDPYAALDRLAERLQCGESIPEERLISDWRAAARGRERPVQPLPEIAPSAESETGDRLCLDDCLETALALEVNQLREELRSAQWFDARETSLPPHAELMSPAPSDWDVVQPEPPGAESRREDTSTIASVGESVPPVPPLRVASSEHSEEMPDFRGIAPDPAPRRYAQLFTRLKQQRRKFESARS